MTKNRCNERRKLISLADALFDDIIAASDEEILSEIAEAGVDGAAISDRMRAVFEETLILARKERMEAARVGRKAVQPAGVTAK